MSQHQTPVFKQLLHNWRFYLLLILLTALGCTAYSILQSHTNLPNDSKIKNQLLLTKWQNQIKNQGGTQAYQTFKQEVKTLPVFEQHFLAHIFGEALYKQESLNGINACDTSFSYGCYHAYLGSAINDKGIEVIPQLNKWCFDTFPNGEFTCQHGIGHGLATHFGYDLNALNQSLSVCESLPNEHPIIGCYGGVFMEFNLRTMLKNEVPARNYDPQKLHYPCNSIDPKYQQACYYQQPSWWLETIPGDWQTKVKKSGDLCNQISNPLIAHQCFKGIGLDIIMRIDADIKQALNLCSTLPTTDAIILCHAGVGKSLMNNKISPTSEICKNLATEEKSNYCQKELEVVTVAK